MKAYFWAVFLAAILVSLYSSAETTAKTGFWKSKPGKDVTVTGTILRTDNLSEKDNEEVGANIQLNTNSGVLDIHVGPMWFSSVRDAAPRVGDPITVVGVRISLDKKPEIIAKEVTINGKTFTVWESDRAVARDGDKK